MAAVPFVAFGGGVLLSPPYALLIPLVSADRHGALTGFYSVSRGVGIVLGPLLASLAIGLLSGVFASTEGYAAMWGVWCSREPRFGASCAGCGARVERDRRPPARRR